MYIFTMIATRVVMGFIFIWAFFDKLLGLGFATTKDHAWIHGGSPTYGFLTNAPTGPFETLFKSIAGNGFVDWLFMLGLLVVGVTLLANRYVKVGAIVGVIMVLLMWLAVLPPTNNPIVDEHIVYALVFGIIALQAKRK